MSWKAVFENPVEKPVRVIAAVWRVRLNSQGYDSRGRYFGLGQPVYEVVAQTTPGQGLRSRYIATEEIGEIRATDRNHAKDLIRRRLGDHYRVVFTR